MPFLENSVSKVRGEEVSLISDKGTLTSGGLTEASGDLPSICQAVSEFPAACHGFLWKCSETARHLSSRQKQAEQELSKCTQQLVAEISVGGCDPIGSVELRAATGPGNELTEGNRGCVLQIPGNCLLLIPPGAVRSICKRNIIRKEPVQIHSLVVIKAMAEQELPGLLILDIGGTHGVQENLVALLKKHFCLITMKEFLENKKEMSKKIQSIFVSEFRPTVDQELLESLPNLKVIGNSGVGVDHLNLKMISSFGVKVTNTPHAVADSTADVGMALMLASARRLVEGSQIAISPDTKYFAVDWLGVEVTRATLGIIGMGRIGYKVAQRARAFEMKILYHNRNQRRKDEEQAVGASYCEKMEDLLQQSDFVMLVVNLTPETHKMIGKKELGLMKPTATLINISRGAVIDQDALVEALQNNIIRAAALDVTYPEPLPRDHPLLKLSNIIITPHIGTATVQAIHMMAEEAIANMLAVLNGQPIPSEVLPK